MKKKKLTANRLLDIMEWIEEYCSGFYSYSVDSYGLVNIKGDLIITRKPIKMEVAFGKVTGSFVGSHIDLKSLKNCPRKVKGNYFVSGSKFKNLKYAPEFVGGHFYCWGNITIMESFSGLKNVKGSVFISDNEKDFKGTFEEYIEKYGDKK